jgi:hypothetical protein
LLLSFKKKKEFFSFKKATITPTIPLAVLDGKMVGGVAFNYPTITQQSPEQLPGQFYMVKW